MKSAQLLRAAVELLAAPVSISAHLYLSKFRCFKANGGVWLSACVEECVCSCAVRGLACHKEATCQCSVAPTKV